MHLGPLFAFAMSAKGRGRMENSTDYLRRTDSTTIMNNIISELLPYRLCIGKKSARTATFCTPWPEHWSLHFVILFAFF